MITQPPPFSYNLEINIDSLTKYTACYVIIREFKYQSASTDHGKNIPHNSYKTQFTRHKRCNPHCCVLYAVLCYSICYNISILYQQLTVCIGWQPILQSMVQILFNTEDHLAQQCAFVCRNLEVLSWRIAMLFIFTSTFFIPDAG